MMNSFQRNKHAGGRQRLLAATVLVLIVFILDILSGGRVRNLVRSASAGVWSAGSGIMHGIGSSGFFSSRRTLQSENDALRKQVAELQENANGFLVLKDENDSLRSLVHIAAAETGITAPIVSSLRSSPYGTFLIGAGANDGVVAGSLVILGDPSGAGFVAGRVRDVGKKTSLVFELFAPDASMDVTIRGAALTAKGQGGENARAEAPRALPVEVGDIVTAPQLGGRAVGIVGGVKSDPSSSHSDVFIGLPVSLSSAPYVYVISP